MKKIMWRLRIAGLLLLAALFAGGIVSSAEETITVNATMKYGQTEAREMLDRVNEFRKGPDAWIWNEGDTTQTVYSSANGNALNDYVYDYGLEKVAMLRAAEIAIYYSHTRPNGEKCFTAYNGLSGLHSENIAAGYATEAAVFVGWQESNEKYDGQGHRRAMLSPDYKYIGIGHVYYNGYHYWVQEFSSTPDSLVEETANDTTESISMDICLSYIKDILLTSTVKSIELQYGDSEDLPEIDCGIKRNNKWEGDTAQPVKLEGYGLTWDVLTGSECVEITSLGKIIGLNCGDAKITATVMDETLTIPVTVTPKDISAADSGVEVTLEEGPFQYTGSEIEPTVTVTANGNDLDKGVDYEVEYFYNINVGEASVVITGIGNYTGEITEFFEITEAELSDEDCYFADPYATYTYTGEEITPEVIVKHGDVELEEDVDYTLSYDRSTDVGSYVVIVSGQGNYTGKIEKSFYIEPAELDEDNCIIDPIEDQEYSKEPVVPEVSITWEGRPLKSDEDFTLSCEDNTDVGTATVIIEFKGNFMGVVTTTFEIVPASLESGEISVEETHIYSGEAITPEITVTLNGDTLVEGEDYEIVGYDHNTDAGDATVSIEGMGNYKGTLEGTFEIQPLSISGFEFSLDEIKDATYNGEEITPEVVLRWNGAELEEHYDYEVTYGDDNINVGTVTVTVTGTGNFTDERSGTFEILSRSLNDEDVSVGEIDDQTFTGFPVEPSIEIKYNDLTLEEGVDFAATYSNNSDAGTAFVEISGTGNYTDKISKEFEIQPARLEDCSVSDIASQTYTGSAIEPEVVVSLGKYKLEKDSDYEIVEYSDNTEVGEAWIVLKGIGNFTGNLDVPFDIEPIDLSDAYLRPFRDQKYSGEAYEPSVLVRLNDVELKENVDYKVRYSNNVNAGTATITVTGIGNYQGTLQGTFTITPLELDSQDCTVGPVADQTFTGERIRPAVSVTSADGSLLEQDVDFEVYYENNRDAGHVTGTIRAKGNYSGELGTVEFEIQPARLADCTVEPIPAQTVTGAAITPPVVVRLGTVSLEPGLDYAVEYANNTAVGTATVTITGLNNCMGMLTTTFAITDQPAPVAPTPGAAGATETAGTPGTTDTPPAGALAVGTVSADSTSSGQYRVTGSAGSGMTVEYMAPTNKKQASVVIPGTVLIDHVPCTVTSIAANAFKNNKKLKAVTIPSGVTRIGKQAFFNCAKLRKITIKTKKLTQKTIGQKAFAKLSGKIVIKVPGNKRKSYMKILRKRGLSAGAKIR